jgi:hypothetical protein
MRRGTVGLILLSCAVPRLLALTVFPDPQRTLYVRIAENLTEGRGYTLDDSSAVILEPLYPVVLALGRFAAGVPGMLLLQIAIGCAGGVALFAIARRRAGDATAWTALLLYAVSPYLVRQSVSFVEVTLATTLAIVAVWSADAVAGPRGGRGVAVCAGGVCGLLLLTRFSFMPFVAGALVTIAGRGHTGRAAIATAALLVVIVPWMRFTDVRGGMPLPPRIGANLFVSTGAWTAGLVPRVNLDVLSPLTDELVSSGIGADASWRDRDRFLLDRALAYVRAHPWDAAVLKLRNLAAVLQPRLVPFTELRGRAVLDHGIVRIPPQPARPLAFEIVAAGYQTLLLGGGAVGLWKRRADLAGADALLILLALSVIAVNVAFFPTSRLLAPMTFVAMFYTAVAIVR